MVWSGAFRFNTFRKIMLLSPDKSRYFSQLCPVKAKSHQQANHGRKRESNLVVSVQLSLISLSREKLQTNVWGIKKKRMYPFHLRHFSSNTNKKLVMLSFQFIISSSVWNFMEIAWHRISLCHVWLHFPKSSTFVLIAYCNCSQHFRVNFSSTWLPTVSSV